ncbi:MAG: ABC transporter permease [Candidatus Limiplasma sp.]|nr:ABC transporter permease [Candidatus Limiplasma sp.]MEA5145119.1 ABC transporter permease [Candidatus Limiplasma sp.]
MLRKRFRQLDLNTLSLFLISLLIYGMMAILKPKAFLTVRNLQGMLVQFPEFGILALGMMLAMISGGIDLSLVGISNLSGIVAAMLMQGMGGSPLSIALAVLAALAVGALCGALNGLLIGYLKIPPMLVTLCGLQLYTGIGLILTKGPAVSGLPEAFSGFANGMVLGIPLPAIVFILMALVVTYLLSRTIYGQQLCLMGSNATASRYSGIDNFRIILKTYILSGLLGAVSGLLVASHYNSAKSDYGNSYTLLTLLIVVLGGTNPDGGRGKVLGVTMAVIVLQLVSSAFNTLRVDSFIKTFVWGLILILVVANIRLSDRRKLNQV